MKANGPTIKPMGMAPTIMSTEPFTVDSGEMIYKMGKVLKSGLMPLPTSGLTIMGKNKESGCTSGVTVHNTLGSGTTIKLMEQGLTPGLMGERIKASGHQTI